MRADARAVVGLLAAVVALPPLLVVRALAEPWYTPKLVAVLVGAATLSVVVAGGWWRGSRVARPPRPVVVTAAAFAGALLWATLLSPHPLRSVTGIPGRWSGLSLALACLVVGVGAATLRGPAALRFVRDGVWLAAVPVLGYALLQWQGVDPLGWRATTSGPAVFATLGNRNFLSGWAAVIAALAAAATCDAGTRPLRRVGGGLVAVLAGAVVLVTTSQQGVVALGAGAAVLASVWLTTAGTPLQRHAGVVGRGLATAGAAVALVVAWGVGPADALRAGILRSLEIRLGKWQAAVGMAAERPWAGVGLDLFADGYHRHRPLWEALERGLHPTTDNAHSVPVQLLAGGGVPLALAWFALVVTVALVGVRGLARVGGAQRLLLGGLLAAWVTALVQGLVSIDVPPLAVLHAALAGGVVAAAGPWPAAVLPAPARVGALALAGGVALGLVAIAVPVTLAERAERRAVELTRELRGAEAEQASARAQRWAPWEPRYALADARRRVRRGDVAGAVRAYETALGHQPDSILAVVELARLHAREGELDAARAVYAHARRVDPRVPQLRVEAARVAGADGDADAAVTLLEAALALEDDVGRWWRELAAARAAGGDEAGAQQALAQAASATAPSPRDALRVPPPPPLR